MIPALGSIKEAKIIDEAIRIKFDSGAVLTQTVENYVAMVKRQPVVDVTAAPNPISMESLDRERERLATRVSGLLRMNRELRRKLKIAIDTVESACIHCKYYKDKPKVCEPCWVTAQIRECRK